MYVGTKWQEVNLEGPWSGSHILKSMESLQRVFNKGTTPSDLPFRKIFRFTVSETLGTRH